MVTLTLPLGWHMRPPAGLAGRLRPVKRASSPRT